MSELNLEKKIRELLELKEMSLHKFCDLIGMSKQNLYRIFKADSVNTSHLQKMAKVLEVEVSSFFLSSDEIHAISKKQAIINIDILYDKLDEVEKEIKSKANFCKIHNFKRDAEWLSMQVSIISEIRYEIQRLKMPNYSPRFIFQ